MKTRLAHHGTIAAITLSLGLAGCAVEQDGIDPTFSDVDEISSALELENGGLDMRDEVALFDDIAPFEDSGLIETEMVFDDAMEDSDEVQVMLGDVDAVLYNVTVMWGQIPGDRENRTPYNWSGALTINRGAILVRSVMAFDGRVDRLAPRDNPRAVAFRSATLPHRDGLRLLIIDPDPTSDEPLILTYRQIDGDTFSAPVDALLDRPHARDMDDAGNQIVAVAMRRPVDVCDNGFLGGRWHKVADHRGRIVGRVADSEGNPMGHVRGIYGHRRNGEPVFFMKYIDRDGQFRGILRGTYGDGHFAGRWVTRAGERGVSAGAYRETRPGLRVGGAFIGRWAERTCNLDLGAE